MIYDKIIKIYNNNDIIIVYVIVSGQKTPTFVDLMMVSQVSQTFSMSIFDNI